MLERNDAMKHVFVNGRVAVIIRYWEQRGAAIEGGARVDIRRVTQLEGPAHRAGAAGFTVAPVGDGGVWRADLFVVLSEGGRECFHYHPHFRDNDVGERFDEDAITADPRQWIEDSLRDLPGILASSGAEDLIASLDMDAHRRSIPLMIASVDACLARVPIASAAMLDRTD